MPIKSQQVILVVGGAGYIGSHMVRCLQRAGYQAVVFDNLQTGHREAVGSAPLIEGDICDPQALKNLFATEKFAAVMHFAGLIQVNESLQHPAAYYQTNVVGTFYLLQAMQRAGVNHFIFSSSAAVYGEPTTTPISESHRIAPINPYGHSKAMVEQLLQDFHHSYGLRYAALRYFNAAGAAPGLAERHEPETHLIPLVLQVASGLRPHITVFGNDYATADGSCVRDYIHVSDICDAHLLALQALWEGRGDGAYNLGSGTGYSVQEVIQVARAITGHAIPDIIAGRRLGDPAVLVADAERAQRELQWQPQLSALPVLIRSAWDAMQSLDRLEMLHFSE